MAGQDTTKGMLTVGQRAALHHAFADERRLAIADALRLSDRSFGALAGLTGMSASLLAFHLGVMECAGATRRLRSEGDRRRRYLQLTDAGHRILDGAPTMHTTGDVTIREVLFVCTANSARSQLASWLWHERTGARALSAGTQPAPAVHPDAVAVARAHGLAPVSTQPRHLDHVEGPVDLVVTVCDRAYESAAGDVLGQGDGLGHGRDDPLHWSVPDPAGHRRPAFEAAFAQLAARVDLLARVA